MKDSLIKSDGELPKTLAPFIWRYLKNRRGYLVGFFFIGWIIALEISVSPYLLKVMIDRVVEYQNTVILLDAILIPAILYVLMNLILNLSFWLLYNLSLRLYPEIKSSIIKDVLSYLMHHSHAFFQNTFSGSLTKKITDLASNIEVLIIISNEWFYARVLAIITAAVTLFIVIKPIFGIIIILWAVLFIYLAYRAAKNSEKTARIYSEASSVLDGTISDSISNIASIKLFANIPHEIAHVSKKLKILIDSDRQLQFKNSKAQLFQDCSVTILIASLLTALIYGRIHGWVSPGDFGLVLMLSVSFIRIVWNIGPQMLKFSKVVGACNQALSFIRIPHEIKEIPDAPPIIIQNGEIKFEDITFQYENNKPLFNKLNVTIKPGEKVGLVGYSGGGKSTFIKLILRFMDPSQGHILIDGQDIKTVTKVSLRKQLGTIPQDPELFHRTIMENIRFAKIDASDEEVIEASKKAKCHKFISELPDQYQSLVGERGVKLSGGQKQRIAIARAFLKNAPILLLDEATSSLDSITERDIQESLHEIMANKTTIVIAHRLSTLKDMDRILVFVNGEIVEDGALDTLLQNNGHFTKIWQMQAAGFIPTIHTSGQTIPQVPKSVADCVLEFNNELVELIPDTSYKIYNNVKNAYKIIDQKVVEYDKKCVSATQDPDIIDLNYVVMDNDEIIAGICADVYIWKILFISLIFVHEDYRNQKLGSLLIKKIEEKAKFLGAKLAHLDTFDFQAKDFYIKHGYEIFGVLDDCPQGHKRYYLRKNL